MKTLKIIIAFFLPILVFGQNQFDNANELYQEEKYQEAVQAYEQVLETGLHSVDVYFNLGNAYYKLNEVAPAIYNYEKALLLEPNNKNVKNNLKFAQNMMIDTVKEVPRVGFNEWLQDFTSVYHYDTWAKIAIGFSFLVLLSFIAYYFIPKIGVKRIFFGLAVLFLIFSVLSVVISAFEKNQTESYNPAIVFSESVSVKSEPNQTSNNVTLIHEGTKVYVLESLDDYYKVELSDRREGWLIQSAVKTLK